MVDKFIKKPICYVHFNNDRVWFLFDGQFRDFAISDSKELASRVFYAQLEKEYEIRFMPPVQFRVYSTISELLEVEASQAIAS